MAVEDPMRQNSTLKFYTVFDSFQQGDDVAYRYVVLDSIGHGEDDLAGDRFATLFQLPDLLRLSQFFSANDLLTVFANWLLSGESEVFRWRKRFWNKLPANWEWLGQLFSFPSYFAHPPFGRKPLSSRRFGKSSPPFFFWPN